MTKPKLRRERIYWSRKLEFKLVEFVRQRECIWKPLDNTNHNISLKYKAYAEFAELIGSDITARSVRDRWVNIRSTFNHNCRKIEHSKQTAKTEAEIYVPTWPLWNACQFLHDVKKTGSSTTPDIKVDLDIESSQMYLGDSSNLECEQGGPNLAQLLDADNTSDSPPLLPIKEQAPSPEFPERRKRIPPAESAPRLKSKPKKKKKTMSCKRVLDDLVNAMKPLSQKLEESSKKSNQDYWFFGKHVVERLNRMKSCDADSASQKIVELFKNWSSSKL